MAFSFRKFLEGIRLIPKSTGTASEKGDLEVTSGDGKLNYHNGTTSSPVVTEAHSATLSNKIIDTASSNTLKVNGNTLSASAGTATVTVPNSTDTLVGRATTDTLTNKTIDGDNNTLQDVGISSLKTVLADADKVIRRDAAGAIISGNAVPNSSALVTTDSSSTLTNKTIDGDNNTIQDVGISSLKTELSDANKAIIRDGSGAIVSDYIADANVKTGAAIARSKIASGTVDHVIINSGTGALSSEAQLAISRGGTGQSTQTAAFNALSPLTTAGDVIVHNGTNNVRLARGTDGQVLVVDNNQTNKLKWTTLQQGAKNYIIYGTFENNDASTGWSLSHSTLDSTTKMPNQASASWTSAAGTLSKSIAGSGQLAGAYSLSLASSVATTAGDMLVTDALTLDLEAQASVQTFSFFYKVTSGAANGNFSGTSSNSIGVAIYVVDGAFAGTWIDPAGRYNIAQSSGVGKASGTFQMPSDATQVRLAVYFPNASSGAITVYLDDFVLGPQVVQYGAPVTDWVSFTPTGSWTTNTTYTGVYRRVGDSLEGQVDVTLSGAPNAVALSLNLPSGFSIDPNKITNTTSGNSLFGHARLRDASGSGRILGDVSYNTSTQLYVFALTSGSNAEAVVTATYPITFAAGDNITINYKVPILGWSSTVQMSNDTDTRVVAANYNRSSGTQALTAQVTDISFPNSLQDTHSAWNGTQFTAPISGFYCFDGSIQISTQTAGSVALFVDGVRQKTCSPNRDVSEIKHFSAVYFLSAGQIASFRAENTYTVSVSADDYHYISIYRLSGPSAIAASETVAAKYEMAASQAISASPTYTRINFGTKLYDSHGIVTTGASWLFTVPVSGLYEVTGAIRYTATTVTNSVVVSIVAASGKEVVDTLCITTAATNSKTFAGTASLLAGDTFYLQCTQNSGGTVTLGSADSYISIQRIGNYV